MSDRNLYLGLVAWVVPDDRRGPIAQLRPHYEASPNLSAWHRMLTPEDALAEFPNRGVVTWFAPPESAKEGTVWRFRIERQPSFDARIHAHDEYKAVPAPAPAPEVIDLRDLGGEEQSRLCLTGEGLELSFIPSGQLYLWVEDESWVGPVDLLPSGNPGRWVLDSRLQQRGWIARIRSVPTVALVGLSSPAPRFFLTPNGRTGPRLAMVDWAADEVVLKRVLRSLRRSDRLYTDALGLTERAIDRVVGGLSAEITKDASVDHYRLSRARKLVWTLSERKELSDSITRDVLQLPDVQSAVHRLEQEVRQQAEERVGAELAESIRRVDDLDAQRRRLEDEGKALEVALAVQSSELDSKVSARLAELVSEPGQLATDLGIIRILLGASDTLPRLPTYHGDLGNHEISSNALPPSITLDRGPVESLSDPEQLRLELRHAFRARGLPTPVARMIHCAMLAGAMPLLAGSGASEALETYAAVVAGGRHLTIPISPATLDFRDLIGRADPGTRRFAPAPGGLLDLLFQASQTDVLYLVILEGANRAAVDSYLAPILASYTDSWRGGVARPLAVLHPLAVAETDPYASRPWVAWPPNVLLAGTLTDGPATVPVAPSLWDQAALIHVDAARDLGGDRPARGEKSFDGHREPGAVQPETWAEWRERIQGQQPPEVLSDLLSQVLASGMNLSPDFRDLCSALHASLTGWAPVSVADGPAFDDRALESVVLHCLVPLAISGGQLDALFGELDRANRRSDSVDRTAELTRLTLS